MTHGSLFSGIGGFDLAAEWMGWENLFHCEFNPFCQRILKYYWPNSKSYGDITKSTFTEFRGRIDILTGGFPCQPFSTAGKRKGTDDSRYLWPEMLRVIREVQPRYIVGENVRGLVSWDGGLVFDTVCSDLEAEGYEVLPVLLPAASVNAPHKRDRIWFVAFNSKGSRSSEVGGIFKGKNNESFRICGSHKETNAVDSNHKGGSSGLGQVQSENGEISERNNDAEFSDSSNGNASDTDSIRLEQCENRTEVERGQGKVCRAGCESTNAIKTNGKIPNASNTDSFRHRGRNEQSESDKHKEWQVDSHKQQYGDRVWGKVEGCSRNASDTDYSRQQTFNAQKSIVAKKDRSASSCRDSLKSLCAGLQWEAFPTVSPICNGDDGLSNRLDSITFPKWRNESIKGGGNAIVPQVALEIFKVIDKLNK